MRNTPSLFLSILLLGLATVAEAARDVTFYLVSDTHVGMNYRKTVPPFGPDQFNAHVAKTLEVLAQVPGTAWQEGPVAEAMKGKGPVPRPLGMIVAGDLTEVGNATEWKDFDRLFPWQGTTPAKYPLFAIAWNHDREMLAAGLVQTLSEDGFHSAWNWQGVHFINVNLYAGDGAKEGAKETSMWNPESSLTFLKARLAKIAPTEPVVIAQHLDFSARSTWWDQPKRKAFYDAIKGHNVIALLHGHTHDITRLKFPEDKDYADWGGEGPRFDCFSAGAFKPDAKEGKPFPGPRYPCECYVFRIVDDTFVAAHYTAEPGGWNTSKHAPQLTFVKKIGK
jgi:cytolysin (calcineurin-like family phosphatase)